MINDINIVVLSEVSLRQYTLFGKPHLFWKRTNRSKFFTSAVNLASPGPFLLTCDSSTPPIIACVDDMGIWVVRTIVPGSCWKFYTSWLCTNTCLSQQNTTGLICWTKPVTQSLQQEEFQAMKIAFPNCNNLTWMTTLKWIPLRADGKLLIPPCDCSVANFKS